MNATRNLLAGSTLVLTLCAAQAGAQANEPTALNNEPLVIYDVSGWGIGSPIHEQLTVYSSGLVTYSTSARPGVFEFVPIERAIALTADLHAEGGALLGDATFAGSDMPLQTITLFSGIGRNSDNNTFSFYDASDATVAGIVELLDDFIAEAFTGVSGSEAAAPPTPGTGAQDPAGPPSTGGRPSTWGPVTCLQPSTGAGSTD